MYAALHVQLRFRVEKQDVHNLFLRILDAYKIEKNSAETGVDYEITMYSSSRRHFCNLFLL